MAKQKFALLKQFTERLSGVYSAISSRIIGIIEVLNTTHETDEETRQLIEETVASLILVEEKIRVEKGLAERKVLRILKRQITKIRSLETYLRISERKATPRIIRKINQLDEELKKLFAAEEVEIQRLERTRRVA